MEQRVNANGPTGAKPTAVRFYARSIRPSCDLVATRTRKQLAVRADESSKLAATLSARGIPLEGRSTPCHSGTHGPTSGAAVSEAQASAPGR